ncbi:hypothetical protein GGI20_002760 [Coemansia sp. BCRC 34301]|nr:hypothetical protein GGI20_002760 [Coemansia sp. BCRC 34301]
MNSSRIPSQDGMQPQDSAVFAHWHADPQGQAAETDSAEHLQSVHVQESALAPTFLHPQLVPQLQDLAVFAHWHADPQGQAAETDPAEHLQSVHVQESALAPTFLHPQLVPQPQDLAVFAHWHDAPQGHAAAPASFLGVQHEGASAFVPQHDFEAPVAGAAPQLAQEQLSHSHLSPQLHFLQLASAGHEHEVTPFWPQVHVGWPHCPPQLH